MEIKKSLLLLLLLKVKGNKRRSNPSFVFVLFSVGPNFDLKTMENFFAGFQATLFLMAVSVFLNLVSFIPY